MTTEAVVTVKWKSAGNAGGELSFDGNVVKPTKTLDISEALSTLTPLDLSAPIYCVQLDNLLDFKKSFLNNLAAGAYDVSMSNLSGYEQDLAFPMQQVHLNNCKIAEMLHSKDGGAVSYMLFGGDLQVHYGGTVYRLLVGKTRLLSKQSKDSSKLDSLYAADPKFVTALFKAWKPIHETYMAMRERAQDES